MSTTDNAAFQHANSARNASDEIALDSWRERLDAYEPGATDTQDQAQDKPQDIYQAIVAARQAVPYVQRQRSQGVPYSFVGIENIQKELRPVLDKFGIVVFPVRSRVAIATQHSKEANDKGKVITKHSQRVIVRIAYKLVHAPSRTSIDTEGVGESFDAGDKATPKAATAALKHMLRQTFLLESGDLDPDTHLAEELGADENRWDMAERALKTAKTLADLDKFWDAIRQRAFSEHQMQSLRTVYTLSRERLANK